MTTVSAHPKLAIIGASAFQLPLIEKAKEKGCETHVFAWKANDVGEYAADHFHPLSIVEHDAILEECRRIGIDGICTIGSDLGNVTVGYVSNALNLPGNSMECVRLSTDKHLMRQAFERHNVPSPKSIAVHPGETPDLTNMTYPLIVKATDRSGSRGINRIDSPDQLEPALKEAFEAGFNHTAVIEEYMQGKEFCVEHFSWNGTHHFLALTEKWTTGAPRYIESGHLQPGRAKPETLAEIKRVCSAALDAVGMQQGASCPEVMVMPDGAVKMVEVGTRMAGEYMGSHAVPLSTGIDYVGAVVDAALGRTPNLQPVYEPHKHAIIKCVLNAEDARIVDQVKQEHPEWVALATDIAPIDHAVHDSSERFGYLVLATDGTEDLEALELGRQTPPML